MFRALGVAIYSFIKNTKNIRCFHIFYNGILPEVEECRIKLLSEQYAVLIILYWIDDGLFTECHSTSAISITAYYRLVAPYVLTTSGIQKCLYVDTDVLCTGDISELFVADLSSAIAYVVRDPTSVPEYWEKYCAFLGMKSCWYFNSGVMLINVPAFVNKDIGRKAMQLAAKNRYTYMDQDVLNILLEDQVISDSNPTYNCTMSVRDDIYNRMDIVKIVHFTGEKKPWKFFTSYWDENIRTDAKYSWKYCYYKLWRDYVQDILSSQLEMHFIELEKLHYSDIKSLKRSDRWIAYFSKKVTEANRKELAEMEPMIKEAMEQEPMFLHNSQLYREYEVREKAVKDQIVYTIKESKIGEI